MLLRDKDIKKFTLASFSCFSFFIHDMQKHVAYHAKGVLVNVFQIVIQGMPHFWETSVAAFGFQVDDVDGGNAGHFVHGDVVVADGGAQLVGEERPIA